MNIQHYSLRRVAAALLKLLERNSKSPFFTTSWSPIARDLLCKIWCGEFTDSDFNAAEAISSAELIEIAYIWLLNRHTDARTFQRFIVNPASNVQKIEEIRRAISGSQEVKVNGRSTPKLSFGAPATHPTIFVDVSNTVRTGARTGIQRVVRELACRFDAESVKLVTYDKGHRHFVPVDLVDDEFQNPGSQPVAFRKGDVYFDIDASWGLSISKWDLYRTMKTNGVRIVNMHYDAVPVLYPESSHEDTVIRYLEHFFAAVSFSDLFVCISDAVRDDAMKIVREIGSRCPPMVTIPLGGDLPVPTTVEPTLDVETLDYLSSAPYVLCVGTVEPRKNYAFFVDNLERIRELGVNIVIVGKKGWERNDFVDRLTTISEAGDGIKWLSGIDDGTLQYLYEHCFAYATSSWYEGFGLPVLEALAKGCAVLSSDRGALVEAGQGLSVLFNPDDFDSFAIALEHLLRDRSWYDEVRSRATSVNLPAWDDAARVLDTHLSRFRQEATRVSTEGLQLVYISTNLHNVEKSLDSFLTHSSIKDVVLMTREAQRDEFISALSDRKLRYTVLCDEEVLEDAQVGVVDHVERNFLLRECLFARPEVDEAFIALDDDCILLRPLPDTHFIKNGKYVGKYFYSDMTSWKSSPFGESSYDRGQWHTGTVLREHGYPRLAYSSHQAQLVHKAAFAEAAQEFRYVQPRCFDEWGFYFNIVAHRYSNMQDSARCTTLFWPMSYSSWVPEWFDDQIYFENYYDINYQSGGVAHEAGVGFDASFKLKQLVCEEAYGKYGAQRMAAEMVKAKVALPTSDNSFGIVESAAIGVPGLWCRLTSSMSFALHDVVYEVADRAGQIVIDGTRNGQLLSARSGLMVRVPLRSGSYIVTIRQRSGLANAPVHHMPLVAVAI
ncbi:glycosyltransferase family 1 protein [Paraburkholderia sp. J67]|uniref:glycosyltransferase family 4 protein n=1 Tax=Paraburkholderia sp. J67 TaxID=2805435 RepID=UPI002ABD6EEE|nr:glycosyltransferase family 1 protein [Paraburkholderia sp. J67]